MLIWFALENTSLTEPRSAAHHSRKAFLWIIEFYMLILHQASYMSVQMEKNRYGKS